MSNKIIQEENIGFLEEIDEVLINEPASRHSYFQLKYFLIGKEPTNQSKMWQCLRELKTRRESLTNLSLEVEETKDQLELLDIKAERIGSSRSSDELDLREQSVKIRKIARQRQALEASILSLEDRRKWLEEECKFFLETFKNIEKTEKLKPFDDLEAQKEYWSSKLAQKMNLKMLTANQLDSELIETIIALPDEMQIKKQALSTLNVRHAQIIQQMKDTVGRIEGK